MIRDWVCDPKAMKLFHDGVKALSQVESNGIRVNVEYVTSQIVLLEKQIAVNNHELKKDPIYKMWKRRFGDAAKIGSKDQLAEVIFRVVGHEIKKGFTATHKLASDEAAYNHLRHIPFIDKYFKNEKLKKAHGYLKGMMREIVNSTIHPNFNLHAIITYRSSSDNPNFQNIPKRNRDIAAMIRRAYVPRPGHKIAEIDISGAEVRISACYNRDPQLITYIKDPRTDMHLDTACDMFFLKPEEVDKKGPRDCCKNMFVFPQFYGSVWFQCAPHIWEAMKARKFVIKDTDIPVARRLKEHGITKLGMCEAGKEPEPGTFAAHVKDVENNFWKKRFPVYTQWKRDYYRRYTELGGFKTLTGFTCWGEFSRNDVLNYPIQGSSFHCLLWSLIQLQKFLLKYKMNSKIVGQIHDSIVLDIDPWEEEDVLYQAKKIMTEEILDYYRWIVVPMKIEAEISKVDGNWHELEEVHYE